MCVFSSNNAFGCIRFCDFDDEVLARVWLWDKMCYVYDLLKVHVFLPAVVGLTK